METVNNEELHENSDCVYIDELENTENEQDTDEEPILTADSSVVTIDAQEHIRTENRHAAAWQELKTSQLRKRILTGRISGIERLGADQTIVVTDYKGIRVVIPMDEMMIEQEWFKSMNKSELNLRQSKLLSGMLGAEIDFVVRGVSNSGKAVAASRNDALMQKRRKFYIDTDEFGQTIIHEGSVVQARVISVSEKSIYIEAFGVEGPIFARDLSWDWFGDARDKYFVGDKILVRIRSIEGNTAENIEITADVKSVQHGDSHEKLKKCKVQSRYAGTIVDIVNGLPYIHLFNGANAIAHTCLDRRVPGKKDEVSFVVTNIDEKRAVAFGIITRIIKQSI